jgi:hypothetical protein
LGAMAEQAPMDSDSRIGNQRFTFSIHPSSMATCGK